MKQIINLVMVTKDKEKKEIKKVTKTKPYAKTNKNSGRKSLLDRYADIIISRTLAGSSVKDRIAGMINLTTYHDWLKIGRQDVLQDVDTQYSEFSRAIEQAESDFRDVLRATIIRQSKEDAKAAMWMLERSDPESYKLRDKVDVEQKVQVSQKAFLEIPDNGRRSVEVNDE